MHISRNITIKSCHISKKNKNGHFIKNLKENHVTKVTKIPKTKGLKYGMNETQEYTLHSLQLNAHRFTIEITKSIKIKANLNILAIWRQDNLCSICNKLQDASKQTQ